MKQLLSFLAFLSIPALLAAQPVIEWEFSFGGTLKDGFTSGNNQQDQVDNTDDGGYIFTGYAYSDDGDVSGHHGLSSTADCWVVKLDSLGGIDWQRSLGGTKDELGYSVRQTSDGGYILVAHTSSDDGDVSGVHYDSTGNVSDIWVVKLDAQGAIVWQKAYGGSAHDLAYSVIETYDNNYVVAGRTLSNDGDVSGQSGSSDIWMLKIDNIGNIIWQKCFGGTKADYAYNVRETSDNGFILCGNTSSDDGDFAGTTSTMLGSAFLIKTDSVANVEWVQVYGGNLFEWGFHVEQTPDGGYAFGINNGSSDLPCYKGNLDYLFLRLDQTGSIVWQNCYGGSDGDWFKAFQPAGDGGFYLIGEANSIDGDISGPIGSSDVWLVKIDSVGNIQWEKSYGGSEPDDGTSIISTPDGGLLIAAESNSNDFDVSGHHGSLAESDCWIAKLAPLTTSIEEGNTNIQTLSVSPVPVSSEAMIKFSLLRHSDVSVNIYDISGRKVAEVFSGTLPSGPHNIYWNAGEETGLEDGMYIVNISDGISVQSQKIIVSN
jgi:hypothetical protein